MFYSSPLSCSLSSHSQRGASFPSPKGKQVASFPAQATRRDGVGWLRQKKAGVRQKQRKGTHQRSRQLFLAFGSETEPKGENPGLSKQCPVISPFYWGKRPLLFSLALFSLCLLPCSFCFAYFVFFRRAPLWGKREVDSPAFPNGEANRLFPQRTASFPAQARDRMQGKRGASQGWIRVSLLAEGALLSLRKRGMGKSYKLRRGVGRVRVRNLKSTVGRAD